MYGFKLTTTETGKVLVHFDNETGLKTYDSLADAMDAMDAIADRINEEKEEKKSED